MIGVPGWSSLELSGTQKKAMTLLIDDWLFYLEGGTYTHSKDY